jgi:hypothetical protein
VKILEMRHLAHGKVQAARQGTVLEQLLYSGDKLGLSLLFIVPMDQ